MTSHVRTHVRLQETVFITSPAAKQEQARDVPHCGDFLVATFCQREQRVRIHIPSEHRHNKAVCADAHIRAPAGNKVVTSLYPQLAMDSARVLLLHASACIRGVG